MFEACRAQTLDRRESIEELGTGTSSGGSSVPELPVLPGAIACTCRRRHEESQNSPRAFSAWQLCEVNRETAM